MRSVFCGSPDFARPSLQALLEAGVDVPLVVSQPDRRRGRRAKPTPTPVRALALENGIHTRVLEKGRRRELYEEILSLSPDVVVVVAFGHIIREPLLHGARWGCVNVHASLLPRWRGPAPIHRAVVAGDRRTGVCTMALAEGVDTGDVYQCAETPIGENETTGELHDRLAALGADTLVSTLEGLRAGTLRGRPQPEEGVTHAPLLDKREGSVDFAAPARRVHDRIRGLDPWPSVTVLADDRRIRLGGSRLLDEEDPGEEEAGRVLAIGAEGMDVLCGPGVVRITSVQPAGGRRMTPLELSRGGGLSGSTRLLPLPDFRPRPEEVW